MTTHPTPPAERQELLQHRRDLMRKINTLLAGALQAMDTVEKLFEELWDAPSMDGPAGWLPDYAETAFNLAIGEVSAHLGTALAIHHTYPTPILWAHGSQIFDLDKTWRGEAGPGTPSDWHWCWTGRYNSAGIPLMTPVGTGDDDLIGSETPFDRVLATEQRWQSAPATSQDGPKP